MPSCISFPNDQGTGGKTGIGALALVHSLEIGEDSVSN